MRGVSPTIVDQQWNNTERTYSKSLSGKDCRQIPTILPQWIFVDSWVEY